LYEADTAGHDPGEVVQRLSEDGGISGEPAAYAVQLIAGVKARRAELDDLIGRSAPQWPVSQLAVIDRNLLRIAIFELLFEDETPVSVAVNEAVELAKTFGGEGSPRFINGVLGTLSANRRD
jgi:N utilization substance protein B